MAKNTHRRPIIMITSIRTGSKNTFLRKTGEEPIESNEKGSSGLFYRHNRQPPVRFALPTCVPHMGLIYRLVEPHNSVIERIISRDRKETIAIAHEAIQTLNAHCVVARRHDGGNEYFYGHEDFRAFLDF